MPIKATLFLCIGNPAAKCIYRSINLVLSAIPISRGWFVAYLFMIIAHYRLCHTRPTQEQALIPSEMSNTFEVCTIGKVIGNLVVFLL